MIYAQEIVSAPEGVENGALVDAVSEKGKYLGSGFFLPREQDPYPSALPQRERPLRCGLLASPHPLRLGLPQRRSWARTFSCCRVIFGEADGFPGLTVDRFENLLVTQTLSVGMERIKEMLFPLLVEVLAEDGVVIDGVFERNDAGHPRP